jgi:hypothetical protein
MRDVKEYGDTQTDGEQTEGSLKNNWSNLNSLDNEYKYTMYHNYNSFIKNGGDYDS